MPDETPPPDSDPLYGNAASTLLRGALDAQSWQPPTLEHLAQMLPQYQIESLIGRGGMGAVYQARQTSLKRKVAIKLLPVEFSADAEFTARFEREAQTLASLSHHGIVTIFEFGRTSEGHLFFVMELVHGTDLAHLLHNRRLEPDQALELTLQVCEALHYAHSQGVVHRDIKPANILISDSGRAKLADFGLARPLSEQRTRLTATHHVMGSMDYMAPEQWKGQADHRTDIYALGVMLYQMLTGSLPQGAFDPPSMKAKVDARLDAVVMKAMSQEPGRRYQHVTELSQAVSGIREAAAPSPRPQAVKPRAGGSRVTDGFVGAAVVGVLLFFGFVAWQILAGHQSDAAPAVEAQAPKPAIEQPVPAASVPTAAEAAPPPEPVAPAAPVLGDDLASQVFVLLKKRCGECHGSEAGDDFDDFGYIDNFAALRDSTYIDLQKPDSSTLFTQVRNGDMPKKTEADRAAKRQPVPFTDAENALLLSWIKAGAPDPGKAVAAPVAAEAAAAEPAREVVSLAAELRAVFDDLQSLPPEVAADTRYVSVAVAHNNSTEVTAKQLDVMRQGVRKVLNSLSTNPRIATFEEVGPQRVLFRVRLRDLGWDRHLWDRITSFYPFAVETSLSATFDIRTPVVRADWLAATATRAPLYNDLLRLPEQQHELESRLGVAVFDNLARGDALRSGFTRSGVSRHNRLAERHEMRAYAGYYWLSYDFKESGGRASLHTNPLGPDAARLLGGAHAFEHAGGEIVFSLPNGLNGYYVSDVTGKRLDGGVPVEIVSDRTNVTGRAEVSNAMACMICHDQGIKQLPRDEIRALSKTYGVEAQRLVEALHAPQEQIDKAVKADTDKFLVALKAAGVTADGGSEPVAALFKYYDRELSLAHAAAELGLAEQVLRTQLGPQPRLFDVKTLLEGDGMSREHFIDKFAEIVTRLNLGTVRGAVHALPQIVASRESGPGDRPIAVKLSTDKTSYRAGEEPVIRVQCSVPAHLRLYYRDASGAITTLFPNALMPDDRIPGGGEFFQLIPGRSQTRAGQDVVIQVTGPPFGTEELVAIVSNQPFMDAETFTQAASKGITFVEESSRDIESVITKAVRLVARPSQPAPVASPPAAASALPASNIGQSARSSGRPLRSVDRVVLHTAP